MTIRGFVGPLRVATFLVMGTAAARGQALVITTGSNLGTWTLGEQQIPLTASGGAGNYAWSYVSGTLPTGLSPRTDVPSFFPAGTTAGLIGVATTAGAYNFTLSVSSGGSTVSQAFTLKVTAFTGKDPYTLPDAFVGASYSYQLTALSNAGPVSWTYTSGIPPGMTLSSGGLLSGSPAAAGNYQINFSLTDGTDTVYRSLGLYVSTVQITSPGLLPNATQNTAYSYTLTASGGTGPYTFSGSLPSGLTLSGAAISGTPTGGEGKYSYYITATDSQNHSYSKILSIDITGTPEVMPQLLPYGNLDDCTVGIGCSRGIGVYSGGTAPFTWNVTGLPAGMSFRTGGGTTESYISPGDVELWGTPATPGSYTLSVTAADVNGLSTTETYVFRVGVLNLDTGMSGGTQGVPYSSTFRLVGGVPPYTAALTRQRNAPGALPDGIGLNGLQVSGTALESGQFNPLFLFTDSSSTANTLTLTQYSTFAGPAGASTTVNFYNTIYAARNQTFSFTLGACCAGGYTWSAVGGTLPQGITLSSAGVLSGTPTTAQTSTFLVQAAQTGVPVNYGTRQITIVVTPLSITTGYTLPYGNVNVAYDQVLAASETGALTWSLAPGYFFPPGLSLSGATGVISGTPSATGAYFFNLQVTDGAGNKGQSSFSLTVYATGGTPPLTFSTGANLGTYAIGEIQDQLIASGGTGSYTWSLASGTLPPGLALRTDIPAYFASNAYAGLIGVATTPGTYSFGLKVTSGTQSITQTFTMKVTGLVGKEDSCYRLPDAFVGQSPAYSYALTALNNAGSVTWTPTYNLPPGLTLSSGGTLAGSPTLAGYYNFYYNISDGTDTVNTCTALNVSTIQVTSPGLLPNATQNASYSYTVAASGGTGPYTYSVNSLPGGLSINSSTGLISGTVTSGPTRYAFALTATDGNNVSYAKTMAIIVIGTPVTLPSIFAYGNFDDCTIGMACERPIGLSSGGGGAPFTWTVTGLPAGMSYRTGGPNIEYYLAPSDVEIYGVPLAAGSYNIQATATDATGATVTGTFPLTAGTLFIDGSDYLPGGTRGVAYSKLLRVLGGGSSPTYTSQLTRGVLPDGLTLGAMTVSGTPLENGNFQPDFTFTETTSGSTLRMAENLSISGGTSTINLNTTNFDVPGSTTNMLGYYTVGNTLSYQLGACCVPSYIWQQTGGALPAGITLSSGGLLTGTFTAAGTYNFLVQAADATNAPNYGVRQYTMVVTPLSITTSTTLPYGNVGTAYTTTITTSAPATFTVITGYALPPGVSLSSGGVVSGTPTATGQYYFYVQAQDSSGNVTIQYVSVSIYPNGAYPPLSLNFGPNLGTVSLGNRTYQLTATGGKAPYHYSITPGASIIPGFRVQDGLPLPTGFSLSGGTGAFLGLLPVPGTWGTSLRVTDSLGATFDRAVNITATSLNVLNVNPPPNATRNSPYAYPLVGYGGTAPYSWSATNLPAGLSINSTTGTISGTPTGSSTMATIQLTDSTGTAISISLMFNVDPFAISTGGVLPQGTIGSAYSLTFAATGCGTGCLWSTTSGSLPSGLSLNTTTGAMTGTPTGFTNDTFTIQVTGSNGIAQKRFSLLIPFNTPQPLYITTTSPIGYAAVGYTFAQALFAQGGTPPYAWSVANGSTLPPGLSLQSPGETVASLYNPGFTYLAGRVMQAGTGTNSSFTFTLNVTDAANNVTSRTYSFIAPPISLNSGVWPVSNPTAGTYGASYPPLVYNTAYAQAQLPQGGSAPYGSWTTVAGNPMPPGLNLDPSSGTISGTPTNTGAFTTLMQLTDNSGVVMQQYVSFNVAANTASMVTIGLGPNLGTYGSGTNSVFNINPSGGTGPYTITPLSTPPPGCAIEAGGALLSNANGTYDLACAFLAAGNYSFTLQATDSLGNIGVRTLNMTVAPFTLYTTTALATGSVGIAYSQQLLTWDNAGTVAWSVAPGSALPPGMALCGSAICGTPSTAGNYIFSLSVTDSSSAAVITYSFSLTISTITITNPQVIPVSGIFNVPYSGYTFTATGGGANKTWTSSTMPAGLTLSSGGVVSGTPTVTGNYATTVTVTDGSSTISRLFTFYMEFSGYELTSNVTLSDARVGQSYSASLLVSAGKPPYTWAVAAGSVLPAGLALYSGAALPPNFIPGATILAGEPTAAGKYTFTLVATDGAGTALPQLLTLNVSPIAIESGGLPNATTGTPYFRQLTVAGGTGPYTFTYALIGLNTPMFATGLSGSATGLISGTPASTGNYSFAVTATDNLGNNYTTTYTMTVVSPSGLEITSSIPFGVSAGRGYLTTLAVTGGSAPYTWSVTSGALPPGFSLSAGGLLGGNTPQPGNFSYNVHVVDTNGLTADRTYNVTVLPMQVILSRSGAQLPAAAQGTSYSYSYRVAGGTAPYTFAESPLYPLPVGMTLDSNGTLHGTPQGIGNFSLYFLLTDSGGSSAYASGGTLVVTPATGNNPLYNANTSVGTYAGAGAAHLVELDQYVYGGVPPLTWTVAPGSSLPAGVSILQGSGSIPSYVLALPPASGTLNSALAVTDSAGQSTAIKLTTFAQTVAIAPDSLPNGTVGSAYSANLTATGGTAPYTFSVSSSSGMPPGITLSSSGALAGVPTYPGDFSMNLQVADSGGNVSSILYNVAIDNAAGQSPGIAISPASIGLSYTIGSVAPAPFPISINATNSSVAFFGAVNGIPGLSLAPVRGTGTTNANLTLNTAGLTAGTYTGAVVVSAANAANQFNAVPVTLTVLAAAPCSYSIDSSGVTVPANTAYVNTFNVIAGGACPWSASVSDPTWVTVSGAGPGGGPVNYSLAANSGTSQRTGTINIVVGGQTVQTFSISEFGLSCSYGISPAAISNLSPAATSVPVAVTVSSSGCPAWTATGLGAAAGSTTGNGSVTLAIPVNNTAQSQTSTATIAGQLFTAIQNPASCTVTLGSYAAEIGAAGTGGSPNSVSVTIPSGCSYSSSASNGVTIQSGGSGTGPGSLLYTVAANSTTSARSLAINIGDKTLNLSQDALACSVTVNAASLSGPLSANGGGPFPIAVNANGSNCSWTASSPVTWATISPSSGTGNGTVNVTVASNAGSTAPRTTTPALNIAGNSIAVTQAGTMCTYRLTSGTGTVPYSGGSGAASVVAPGACSWNGQSNTTWLHVASSGSGGSSDVQFVADPNVSTTARTGTISINGAIPPLTYTVSQGPATCAYRLGTSSSGLVNFSGYSGSFGFTTGNLGCTPIPQSYAGWLHVSGDSFSGTAGILSYSVDANPNGSTRTGFIKLEDGSTYTVTQSGASCAFSLNSYGGLFSTGGGTGSVQGSPSANGCTPAVGTTQPGIVTIGSLSGPVLDIFTLPYTVLPYISLPANIRKVFITFGGQTYAIKQTSW